MRHHPTDTITRVGTILIAAAAAVSVIGFAVLGYLHAIEHSQDGWGEES